MTMRPQLVPDAPTPPPESAADHIRNALQILIAHEREHPALWAFDDDRGLRTVEALLLRSLYLIDLIESGAP